MKINTIRGLLGLLAFGALLCSVGCNSMARDGRNSDADADGPAQPVPTDTGDAGDTDDNGGPSDDGVDDASSPGCDLRFDPITDRDAWTLSSDPDRGGGAMITVSGVGSLVQDVTLFSNEGDELDFEFANRLHVLWADRESFAHGDFPPIDFSSFGGRMEVSDEAPLSQFQGSSTEGEWRLNIASKGVEELSVAVWCIVVNDELPPLAEIFEECSENTPLDYEFVKEKGKGKEPANLTDTLQVNAAVQIAEVEVSTDITQVFIGDLGDLRVTSPVGTTVPLATKGLGGSSDDLLVIWSDNGVFYDQFPKGDTTFGGRMQPIGSKNGGLSNFAGEPSDGEWELHLEAFASGTLNDWCVIIEENL